MGTLKRLHAAQHNVCESTPIASEPKSALVCFDEQQMDVSRWRPPERVQGTLVLCWCRTHPDAFIMRMKKANCPPAWFKVGDRQRWKYNCWKSRLHRWCLLVSELLLCFCNMFSPVTALRMMMMMMSIHWLEGNTPSPPIHHQSSHPDTQKVWLTVLHLDIRPCSKNQTSDDCFYSGSLNQLLVEPLC